MKPCNSVLSYLYKKLFLSILLIAVYLIVAIPFKVMEVIPGFTDIRPVMLLQPIYGVFFGIPGCFASAIGNFICDILSGSLHWSCIAGFLANFLGPFLFYLYWKYLSKTSFHLQTTKNLLIHCILILLSATVQTALITPFVVLFYPDVQGTLFALTVMLNTTLFPLFIGIPIIILMQEELDFQPIKK